MSKSNKINVQIKELQLKKKQMKARPAESFEYKPNKCGIGKKEGRNIFFFLLNKGVPRTKTVLF